MSVSATFCPSRRSRRSTSGTSRPGAPIFRREEMRLYAVGVSHRTAPVELRECIDFARQGVDRALSALAERGLGRELVVLSTCNRAEIYAVTDAEGPESLF